MKRKDWISLVAMLIIVTVALIGEQFCTQGSWTDAAISISIQLLPLLLFFVFAVVARNRKGSYVKTWRIASYACFAISVVFLLMFSVPFMHYFNVIGNQSQVKSNVQYILNDCNGMFDAYEKKVSSRVSNYDSNLKIAINQDYKELLNEVFPTAKNITLKDKNNAVNAWKVKMFTNHAANKQVLEANLPIYKNALIDNFSVFDASGQLHKLITSYNDFKTTLQKDFSELSPSEKILCETYEFKFDNQELKWMNAEKIFTQPSFNFLYFVLYLILALFACTSYIFFKDENVQTPKMRAGDQSVYQCGHKL